MPDFPCCIMPDPIPVMPDPIPVMPDPIGHPTSHPEQSEGSPSNNAKILIKNAIFGDCMEKIFKYSVAGHNFAVELPEGCYEEVHLRPYLPFSSAYSDADPLFTLKVLLADNLKDVWAGDLKDCMNEEAPYFWIFQAEGHDNYNFGFSYSKSSPDCILKPSEDFRNNTLYVPSGNVEKMMEFAVSNAMMLLYTFCTTPLDTLMVHASVIAHAERGYMFLGKSGTGKSTHSRLWLSHIEDTELLNDDNPVIRFIDGEVYVYGTPWSGKTPCYKNRRLPLKAVVRLSQAPYNKIERLRPLQAYASLMPSCSCMRWDRSSTDALHKTVEKVIAKVACWHLDCLPDEAAALTCHEAVTSR